MIIDCKNISKIYTLGGIENKVLDNISFAIDQGEFVAIMGPSGSGKSTLMNIIGMLDNPTSGAYLFKNKNVAKLSDDKLAEMRLNSIGFVFQMFNLLPRTTVFRNVMLPFIYSGYPPVKRQEKAKQALLEAGLDDPALWTHLSNQLSGGQMQRVAIARAIVNDPEIILADEPTGNLDSKTGEVVLETFERLNKQHGRSIIMITHEIEVAEFADRIIFLKDGKITEDRKNTAKRTAKQGFVK